MKHNSRESQATERPWYRGLAENERALSLFFGAFPDYDVVLEGHASSEETLICWGTAHMTMTGDGFGAIRNGKRAELPVFIQFGFKDDLIAGERFFFDLSSLCAKSGVSADVASRIFFEATEDFEPLQIGDQPLAAAGRA